MADSTVILQHVCSVSLFVVCFVGIYQERVSPVSLVSGSSFATFLGWILWERWVSEEMGQEEDVSAIGIGIGIAGSSTKSESIRRRARAASIRRPIVAPRITSVTPSSSGSRPSSEAASSSSSRPSAGNPTVNIQIQIPESERLRTSRPARPSSTTTSPSSTNSPASPTSPTSPISPISLKEPSQNAAGADGQPLLRRASSEVIPDFAPPNEANRLHQRIGTIKSAILIYSTLLGLSPILKSLTQSTSEDSIWAMSLWLLAINIFFFDYSGGVGAKFPASLSTNAALMASTVLASRLPSTKQVFCLTLFSIEVFGLFPVFRRYVQHRSFWQHVILTALLILGAGWGVGVVMREPDPAGSWPWRRGLGGMVVSVLIAAIATGGCSWWLIGMQRYKNEIRGPWDPARPIIMSRQRWESQ